MWRRQGSSWARRANARSRTAGTSTRTRWAGRDSTTSPRSGGGRSELDSDIAVANCLALVGMSIRIQNVNSGLVEDASKKRTKGKGERHGSYPRKRDRYRVRRIRPENGHAHPSDHGTGRAVDALAVGIYRNSYVARISGYSLRQSRRGVVGKVRQRGTGRCRQDDDRDGAGEEAKRCVHAGGYGERCGGTARRASDRQGAYRGCVVGRGDRATCRRESSGENAVVHLNHVLDREQQASVGKARSDGRAAEPPAGR